MTTRLIDGKKVASDIKEDLKKEVIKLRSKGTNPCLAIIFDATYPPSKKYFDIKRVACDEVGIDILNHAVQKKETDKSIIKFIERLNKDQDVNGILLQFPFRKNFNQKTIAEHIAPEKDIDACSPYALSRLFLNEPLFLPCTPYGVMKMLDAYRISLSGKRAVVIERGITGRTLAHLLLRKNAVVTLCTVSTPNLKEECLKADILCVDVGKPEMITADMVK
ncbi:MAG: bifunctional 5,10-methylene-tetrahydrofolate dehydrogenase/5,10-methylene-tetrahydrofolate cyclohydrolase, partial [Nitrospirae bacterium]|nr:bifunctional 5,10-methylene-tetrahydrofolate dehydrogenase/5,10-methylene-tetrahydrofolate cyclohydrolase [Nitrospirota bacterium]